MPVMLSFAKRIDEHMRQVLKGAALVSAIRFFGVGCAFVFNVLLARKLGAQGAGVYFLSVTVITIGSVLGRVGLENAMMRFASSGAAMGDWDSVSGVCRTGMRTSIVVSGLLSVLVFIGAPWIAAWIFSEPMLTIPLRVMAFSIVPVSLIHLYSGLLKAVQHPGYAAFNQGLGVSLMSLILFAVLAGVITDVDQVALIFTASTYAVLGVSFFFWIRSAPEAQGRRGKFDKARLMNASLPLLFVSSMNLLMAWTDKVMIGIWLDSKAVGLYTVALRTAMLTSFILVAVNSISAPKFAALYAEGSHKALSKLARQSTAFMVLLAFPVLVFFMAWPEIVLRFFGQEFISAAVVLTILSAGQFVNVSTGSVGYLLMMTGHEKLVRNNLFFFAVINVALNLLLIPRYGIVGAAIATASSLSLKNVVGVVLVYLKLSILTLPIPSSVLPRRVSSPTK